MLGLGRPCKTSLAVFHFLEEGFGLLGQDSELSSCRAGLEAAPALTSIHDPSRDLLSPGALLPGSGPSTWLSNPASLCLAFPFPL